MSDDWAPRQVLPPHWRMVEIRLDGARYVSRQKLMVITSMAVEQDGRRWVHLSASHKSRIPTWSELVEIRDIFLGDVYAYQVLAPRDKHVNINDRVLHLWHCLDEVPMPDFTQGTGSL